MVCIPLEFRVVRTLFCRGGGRGETCELPSLTWGLGRVHRNSFRGQLNYRWQKYCNYLKYMRSCSWFSFPPTEDFTQLKFQIQFWFTKVLKKWQLCCVFALSGIYTLQKHRIDWAPLIQPYRSWVWVGPPHIKLLCGPPIHGRWVPSF